MWSKLEIRQKNDWNLEVESKCEAGEDRMVGAMDARKSSVLARV
jgi:hypothetical protein